MATSDLAMSLHPDAVLVLGDNQYEESSAADYQAMYEPSWGRLKALTHPSIGNHEYLDASGGDADPARGYFDYFGAAAGARSQGWYSFDVGTWHLVALNSECSQLGVGGCSTGSVQQQWLEADLAAHPNACTLAFMHEPRFTSGSHDNSVSTTALWNTLVDAHADIMLSGHNHDYERFDYLGVIPTPNSPDSETASPDADPNGMREFVVGVGGKSTIEFIRPALRNEQVRDDTTFGVLALTLHPTSYDWAFVPAGPPNDGTFTDVGTGSCH
ncbi:MAG: metallophosphoesterase [Nakamurella sp.]